MPRQKPFIFVVLVVVVIATIAFGSITQASIPSQSAPTSIPGSGKITAVIAGEATSLIGIGTASVYPLFTQWFTDYAKLSGVQVTYPDQQGSGRGLAAINNASADFGASDAYPVKADGAVFDKVTSGAVIAIPTTLNAVVMIYNLPNFKDPLKLTPNTLSAIYLGTITRWNDPALVADNPGLSSVTDAITPVHRADSSSVTNSFSSYLGGVSQVWAKGPGISRDPRSKWPVTGLAGKGNDGMQSQVAGKPGTIGYVAWSYATSAKLTFAQLKNKADNFVVASPATVTNAAALTSIPADLNPNLINAPAANAYPITSLTWQFVYKAQADPAKALALTRLLWWELHDGQPYGPTLGYAPLPYNAIQAAEQQVRSITVNGKQALPATIVTSNTP